LKAITEAILRTELKTARPEVYYIPEGKILSPAAREYLNQLQIDIDFEKNRSKREAKPTVKYDEREASSTQSPGPAAMQSKYVDYETGAFFPEKPECMTQLFGNKLVYKNDPIIKYRGKIDKVQAQVVYTQAMADSFEKSQALTDDLDDILRVLREMMRSEVMGEPFSNDTILGLNHDELRAHSHDPMKYYKIKQMVLPDHSMGIVYSLLNILRTSIREAEVLAVDAFTDNKKCERQDIVEELNRLSSAIHIMMCKYLAKEY
jgi:Ethanolamine utilization cobalamin adenosyltransferase